MALMRQAAPLTMGWCLDCHRHSEAPLRPENEIFATDWHAADQAERGRQLLEHYHCTWTEIVVKLEDYARWSAAQPKAAIWHARARRCL